MLAKIIPIGTSKGVRIPKYLLDKYNLHDTVEFKETHKGILIHQIKTNRDGWEQSFTKLANTKKQEPIIDMPASDWDINEWEW